MVPRGKDLRLVSFVPKLRGNQNYADWVSKLEIWCNNKDSDYWPIYTGVFQPEIEESIAMCDFERRNRCASELHLAVNQVTADQLKIWTKINITDPNERFMAWKTKNDIMLAAIISTTSPAAQTIIGDERNASKVNAKLFQAFGRATREGYLTKFDNWVNLTYKPGMSPHQFVNEWNLALADKIQYESLAIVDPRNLEHYSQFLRAVRAHGGMNYWLESQHPHMNSPTLLTDAIASFLDAETYRKTYLRNY